MLFVPERRRSRRLPGAIRAERASASGAIQMALGAGGHGYSAFVDIDDLVRACDASVADITYLQNI
jgi:hypothetical protein